MDYNKIIQKELTNYSLMEEKELEEIDNRREDYPIGEIYNAKAEVKRCLVRIDSQKKIRDLFKRIGVGYSQCEEKIKSLEEELTQIREPIKTEYEKWDKHEKKMFEETNPSKAAEMYLEMKSNSPYKRALVWAGTGDVLDYDPFYKILKELDNKLGRSFTKNVVERLDYQASPEIMRMVGLEKKAFEDELNNDIRGAFNTAKGSKERLKKVAKEHITKYKENIKGYKEIVWRFPEELADACEKHNLFEEALEIYDLRINYSELVMYESRIEHHNLKDCSSHFNKIRMLRKLGRKKEALEECDKIREYSGSAIIANEAAIIATELGMSKEAGLYAILASS